MILQAAALCFFFYSVHTFTIQAAFENNDESSGNPMEEEDMGIGTLLERANVNVGKGVGDPLVLYGDIAIPTGLENADPCTDRQCKWPKASDGNVYVPYQISRQFSQQQQNTILQGLQSFAASTCIRFIPRRQQRDFVDIQSRSGCFSFIGRRGNGQVVSLSRQGCVFQSTIQHEMLHALGFNHEQTRSDRDRHVRIISRNIIRGMETNFNKVNTRNLGTPYDYGSVMHYGRFAFSMNGQATIVPIPNPNVSIGRATRMSPIDIRRVNILYACRTQDELMSSEA